MQRDLPRYVIAQSNAEWSPSPDAAREVNGMRALIVGYGSIGRAVAQRLRAFRARVHGIPPHAREDAHGMETPHPPLPGPPPGTVLPPPTPRNPHTPHPP